MYTRKLRWKFLLFAAAVSIGVSSLWYTNNLVKKLAVEERKRAELLAEAQQKFVNAELTDRNLDFYGKVMQNNETVPVIVVDSLNNILFMRNLDSAKMDNPRYVNKKLKQMKETTDPIIIRLSPAERQFLYYSKSTILTKLTFYPLVQLGIILLFILVAYFAFSSSRNAEQNQVWVGLSKETAHQLGTPISSLLAWLEMMKLRTTESDLLSELEKDIKRLEKITERFSKIGSKPILKKENLVSVISTAVNYLKSRTSGSVIFNVHLTNEELLVPLNASLFEWVIENICKNAIDATNGKGEVEIFITDHNQVVFVDISDTGKGISKGKFKTIFKPGYTTKERGWGLGLSLAKRIVEEYHDGKIFVHQSELGKGTVIRIVLKKQ
ncbi:MAG: HAMP domain-containing histidine kinase [Bacteroidales bacterium]|nr:HAMP domain-containing histidine kinase [Bacteroidales bacterium]MBN2764322.1 HAMP domain-containing histidine kinase [Bacteroidales bacterium]